MRFKKMLQWMNDTFETIDFWVTLVVMLGAVLWMIGLVAKVISPTVTLLFVVSLTMYAFERKQALWVIGGLLLYGASWPILPAYGPMTAMLVCSTGVGIWFLGVYRAHTIVPSHG